MLAERVLLTLHQLRLDEELACGADPVTTRELALRAGQLTDPRRRARFARSLRRAIAAAELPAHRRAAEGARAAL